MHPPIGRYFFPSDISRHYEHGENKTIYEKEGIAKIGEVMLQISALGDWRRVEG